MSTAVALLAYRRSLRGGVERLGLLEGYAKAADLFGSQRRHRDLCSGHIPLDADLSSNDRSFCSVG